MTMMAPWENGAASVKDPAGHRFGLDPRDAAEPHRILCKLPGRAPI